MIKLFVGSYAMTRLERSAGASSLPRSAAFAEVSRTRVVTMRSESSDTERWSHGAALFAASIGSIDVAAAGGGTGASPIVEQGGVQDLERLGRTDLVLELDRELAAQVAARG